MNELDALLKQFRVRNVLLEAIGEAANKGLSGWNSQGRKLGAQVRRQRRQRVLGPVLEPR